MPEVICFDDKAAEIALKDCPKIVKDYVKLLKENKVRWQDLTNRAINRLRTKRGDKYLDRINNLMWNTWGIKDAEFGREQGKQIMDILNEWAKEEINDCD